MLDTIKKLEVELELSIETAKATAAATLQSVRTKASDERVKLEDDLRNKEAAVVEESEKKATQEADALLAQARTLAVKPDPAKAHTIATSVLKSYLS
jgi:vacuolar-type H+-ATPase subunit H